MNRSGIAMIKRKNVFTLIELLVVIAIIGILASMLLPALKKAKDLSMQMACLNNEKQLSLAFQMYVNENDNQIPPYDTYKNTWFAKTWTYYKSSDVLRCQSDNNPTYVGVSWNAPAGGYTMVTAKGLSYLQNELLQYYKKSGAPMNKFKKLSEGAVYLEGRGHWAIATDHPERMMYRHLGGMNVLYLDGHARLRKGVLPINHTDAVGKPFWEGL
jgi:prepilin-type N-terminal cleavage/methylation domain-containing protein/prepilin-type processing-associated H-X9-DG protein